MLSRKINILLLGETGVGKSTFINMFGNYLSGRSLHEIASGKCNLLVPIKFALQNQDFVEEIVEIGHSEYEIPGTGNSATQRPQMYHFNYPEHDLVLNIIDTPGVADTRGLDYDEKNTEVLLRYISELDSIDAFCILLKPDVTRISLQFELSIMQILEQLDASITKNIIFLITNGRMRNFTIGDTKLCLDTLLKKINCKSGATIPFNSSNTFCIDNESFRYITARQQGIQFIQNEVKVYQDSFTISTDTIKRMIVYITNLQPAKMQGVRSINECKRIILRLIDPLIALAVLYENVITKIQHYTNDLEKYKTDIDYLKKNMYKIEYVPAVMENNEVSVKTDFNFCLDFGFGKITWQSILKQFKFILNIFNNQVTKNVSLKEKKVLDTDTVAFIKDRESGLKAVRDKLFEMNEMCQEYDQEIKTALTAIACFSVFIENLKLIAGQDYFKIIMKSIQEEHQIDNNPALVKRIKNCMQKYTSIKNRTGCITAKDVMNCVNDLFTLKHTGHIFKEIISQKVDFNKVVFQA